MSHTIRRKGGMGSTERSYDSAQDARTAAAHEIGAMALNWQSGTVEAVGPAGAVWLRLTTEESPAEAPSSSHSAMAAALADERQRSARLREALQHCQGRAQSAMDGRPIRGGSWSPLYLESIAEEIRDACAAALAGEAPQPPRGWTFALEDRPEWHSIPVGVVRAADEDVLFVQFYPEWQDHREAVALVLAAANGGRADG